MLRAAAWTCGLFAAGGGVVHLFPGQFTEPLVLLALGATMLLVSGKAPAAPHAAESSTANDSLTPSRAAR